VLRGNVGGVGDILQKYGVRPDLIKAGGPSASEQMYQRSPEFKRVFERLVEGRTSLARSPRQDRESQFTGGEIAGRRIDQHEGESTVLQPFGYLTGWHIVGK
jgi:hypothetical protein